MCHYGCCDGGGGDAVEAGIAAVGTGLVAEDGAGAAGEVVKLDVGVGGGNAGDAVGGEACGGCCGSPDADGGGSGEGGEVHVGGVHG